MMPPLWSMMDATSVRQSSFDRFTRPMSHRYDTPLITAQPPPRCMVFGRSDYSVDPNLTIDDSKLGECAKEVIDFLGEQKDVDSSMDRIRFAVGEDEQAELKLLICAVKLAKVKTQRKKKKKKGTRHLREFTQRCRERISELSTEHEQPSIRETDDDSDGCNAKHDSCFVEDFC